MTSTVVAAAAPKPKPPNAGKGRKKGVPNKTTAAVKDALNAVYADLQHDAGGDHAHFRAWALANPTEFYKLWVKMLPTEISGPGGGPVQIHAMADALLNLPPERREQIRAAIKSAINPADPS
jgi:hypothetical protein